MSTTRTWLIDNNIKVEDLEDFYKAPTTSFRAWGACVLLELNKPLYLVASRVTYTKYIEFDRYN